MAQSNVNMSKLKRLFQMLAAKKNATHHLRATTHGTWRTEPLQASVQ